jgi:hypothetical protein
MTPEDLLDRIVDAETDEAAIEGLMFHGTIETFSSPLVGGAYDGILWTAHAPAIAQTYVPAAGVEALVSIQAHRLDERVRPRLTPSGQPDGHYQLAIELGFPPAFDVVADAFGLARSWGIPDGFPTNAELLARLSERLGYPWDGESDFSAWIKQKLVDGRYVHVPADHRESGRLFVIAPIEPLRILDHAAARGEGDLLDPEFRHFDVFEKAAEEGFDAVRINDFGQSKRFGNFGHHSIGLLPAGLAKTVSVALPCHSFDWPENGQWPTLTDDFIEARRKLRSERDMAIAA